MDPGDGEVWADMVAGWAILGFGNNSMGNLRNNHMQRTMFNVLSAAMQP